MPAFRNRKHILIPVLLRADEADRHEPEQVASVTAEQAAELEDAAEQDQEQDQDNSVKREDDERTRHDRWDCHVIPSTKSHACH